MKNFREAVKWNQEKHEWMYMFPILRNSRSTERELVDLVGINREGKVTLIRARGNGHGRLSRLTIMQLQVLGKKCGARVLFAHLNGENQIVFEILL